MKRETGCRGQEEDRYCLKPASVLAGEGTRATGDKQIGPNSRNLELLGLFGWFACPSISAQLPAGTYFATLCKRYLADVMHLSN